LAMAAYTSRAHAHMSPMGMQYDGWCCRGTDQHGDCAPIPATSVHATPDGWVIVLHPGDHPMVTKTHTYTKKYGEERESTDGSFHACLYPDESTLRCFYASPPGS